MHFTIDINYIQNTMPFFVIWNHGIIDSGSDSNIWNHKAIYDLIKLVHILCCYISRSFFCENVMTLTTPFRKSKMFQETRLRLKRCYEVSLFGTGVLAMRTHPPPLNAYNIYLTFMNIQCKLNKYCSRYTPAFSCHFREPFLLFLCFVFPFGPKISASGWSVILHQ